MIPWSSIYLWDNSASAYVDLEFAAADQVGASVSLMGQTTDKLYMGLDRTFPAAYVELDALGSYNALPDYEYYNGSAWANLPLIKVGVVYAYEGNGNDFFNVATVVTDETLTLTQ